MLGGSFFNATLSAPCRYLVGTHSTLASAGHGHKMQIPSPPPCPLPPRSLLSYVKSQRRRCFIETADKLGASERLTCLSFRPSVRLSVCLSSRLHVCLSPIRQFGSSGPWLFLLSSFSGDHDRRVSCFHYRSRHVEVSLKCCLLMWASSVSSRLRLAHMVCSERHSSLEFRLQAVCSGRICVVNFWSAW